MNMNAKSALQQYSQTKTHTETGMANPHRLIQMLLDGALEKITKARGFMERKNIEQKGIHISWAISIIDGLRMSLDKNAGGEIAENLDALYDYMERRLLDANVENNLSYLDEVTGLLKTVKSAWDDIPEEFKQQGQKVDASNAIASATV